jgi:hypothetical protein
MCPETKAEEDRDLQKQRLSHTYVFSAAIANAEGPRMEAFLGTPRGGALGSSKHYCPAKCCVLSAPELSAVAHLAPKVALRSSCAA